MTRWLLGSGLRLGRLILAAVVAAFVLGIQHLGGASVDAFPEFTPPTVEVQTESLGLSAGEVESLVTVPLEQDLLNGVPWVDHISSRSVPGLSAIDLVFKPGTDSYAARQMVQERMTQIRALPNVGTPPVMIQPLASTSRVAMIGLAPTDPAKLNLVDLSVLARWKIRPLLMGVPGVANVAIYGQRDRQLQVQVDPVRMSTQKVSLSDVITTAANALWVSPLTFVQASTPGTGGFIESPNQRLAIQHVLPITSTTDLAAVPVTSNGTQVRLGDVASVVVDHQPLIGDAVTHSASSLVLVVEKFPGASTEDVTRRVEAAMRSIQPGLTGVTVDPGLYRPATYLETAMRNLGLAGLLGLALLIVVLTMLAWSWRTALITVVSLSLSLVAAASVLQLRGVTFTSMTLVGLGAAAVVIIDDVVTDVDLVRRRLRERAAAKEPGSTASVVLEACLQSRGSLAYGTLILILVTTPALFLGPFAASFSRPLVASYVLALLVSMVVALLVTPTLSVLLLTRAGERSVQGPAARWLQPWFDRRIDDVLAAPRKAFAVLGLLAIGSLVAIPQLGASSPLPVLRDPSLLVQLRSMPGTSLPEMDRISSAVGAELSGIAGVRGVGLHVGRAVTSDQAVDVNSSELWVTMDPGAEDARTRAAISSAVHGYPGLMATVGTYTGTQLSGAQQGSGVDLLVRVYGNDLATLQSTARTVQKAASQVPGVTLASVAPQQQEPSAQVVVNLEAAARYGLRPGDVRREATTMMSGLLVGNLYENQAVFDVVVTGPADTRHSLTSLQNLPIDVGAGHQVPLHEVATVMLQPEPTVIRHEGVSRSVDVSLAVSGRDLSDVTADVNARVHAVTMPLEFHAEVLPPAGGYASEREIGWQLFAIAAAVAVFLLLQAAARSWRLAGALLVTIALSCSGGLLGAALTGGITSVGALGGLLAALGLAVRQSVLLVRDLPTGGNEPADLRARIALATRRRVLPMHLAGLAAVAMLVPAVVLGNRAGLEVMQPFAVTAIGALVTAVPVVLLVLPAVLLRMGATRRPADQQDIATRSTPVPDPVHRRPDSGTTTTLEDL